MNAFVGLQLRTPRLSPADAVDAVRVLFGIDGTVRELGSHQDQNFRVDADGAGHVLKVANAACSVAELDLQNRAMEHVGAALPGLIPVPLRARDGRDVAEFEVAGARYRIRLLTYLEGEPLRHWAYLAPAVLHDVGGLAGRVAAAMASFDHPAADRALQWDVRHAAEVVAAFAPQVRDGDRRALAERTMERAAETLQNLGLRQQVIHGDVTGWNVLARPGLSGRPRLCGVIDFGDVARSWLAAECAVLVATLSARSLQNAVHLVRGFHAAAPLLDDEVAGLPALVAARAALSAVSGERQAAIEPDNAYAAACVEDGWQRLAAIAAVPVPLAQAAFREACGLPRRTASLPTGAGPLVAGLKGRPTVPMDLSVRTDALRLGGWREPAQIAAAIAGAAPDGVAVGRHGEARITADAGPSQAEPATVHLGADVFLPEGSTVLAPLPGHVVARGERALVIAVDDGFTLRLAGIVPTPPVGHDVQPGEPIGRVAQAVDRLPAHLHVQLADGLLDELPGLVPASLAAAWLSLCPDPGPVLGLDLCASPPDPQAVLARRERFVASPQLMYYPSAPPEVERGWRQWLYDAHGRAYLDMINNVAVLGHSHPRVEAAAARQLRLLNTNSRFLYDALGRLAERVIGLVPAPLDVVFFVNSGSEANDLALRLAREVTGRGNVLCHEGAYHGWTTATIETERALLSGRRADHDPRVHPIARPSGDADASLRHVREVVGRHPPAALICEPLLGNEGGIVLPPGHLQRVYAAVRSAGGLCIADEVQVGYGRLGHHFWAFQQQEVVPDIVTIGKATGNGHPVAAVITTRAIADAFARQDDFFSSVGGSPVSCEVALAVLDVLDDERLQANARDVGDYLTARLSPFVGEHALVDALHGMGLYQGLELATDNATALAICERMRDLGVIVQPTGPRGNVLKLKPPLCVARNDIDLFADALQRALTEGW